MIPKKLSEKKRELLFDEITARAADYSIAMATEREIDEINILQATFLAMRRAFDGLHRRPDLALIDGQPRAGSACRRTHACQGRCQIRIYRGGLDPCKS